MRYVVLMLVLVGCATDENDARVCSSYGWPPGSESFNTCVSLKAQDRRDAALRNMPIIMPVIMPAPYQPIVPYQMPQYRAPVQTNCQRFGNTVNCTSY